MIIENGWGVITFFLGGGRGEVKVRRGQRMIGYVCRVGMMKRDKAIVMVVCHPQGKVSRVGR